MVALFPIWPIKTNNVKQSLRQRRVFQAQMMARWHKPLSEFLLDLIFELWSDVLFERAHRFYEKHGFVHDGTFDSLESFFSLNVFTFQNAQEIDDMVHQ